MLKVIQESKCFGGMQYRYEHASQITNCPMRFGLYLPENVSKQTPLLYWLSGLTCTEENFIIKSGMQQWANKYGVAVLNPDTSPRGSNYPKEHDDYDFGSGAGFYVDATQAPWVDGYQMYSYVSKELPEIVDKNFELNSSEVAISGHSMGGHGALILALKNPRYFTSVSAFAPICSAMHSPWGIKALGNYLGTDTKAWAAYDACELIKTLGWQGPEIIIEFGTADIYLNDELKAHLLKQALEEQKIPFQMHFREGYDHGYHFVGTFLEQHFQQHNNNLAGFLKGSVARKVI